MMIETYAAVYLSIGLGVAIYLRVVNKNKMPLAFYLFAMVIWPLILLHEINI